MIHPDYKKDATTAHKAYLTVAGYAMANKPRDAFYHERNVQLENLMAKHGWNISQFGLRRKP